MNKPSVKKNYLYNLFYQILTLVMPLITTPYVSRVLQVDGIGEYSFTLSVVSYFAMFGTLGLNTYGQLQVAGKKDDIIGTSTVFFEISILKAVLMAISSLVYTVYVLKTMQYKSMFIVMYLYLIYTALDITWFFQGIEEFKKIVLRNYVIKLAGVALIFLFVKSKGDLILYGIVLQGIGALGSISIWPYLLGRIRLVKNIRPFRHLKASFVYFIPSIAISVYTMLDKSMIGWLTNSAYQNGIYEQAHKVEQMVVVVVSSLSTVTLPRLVYLYKNNDRENISELMDSTLHFVLGLSIPMCVGLIGVSSRLIPVFLGDDFYECIPLLRVFSLLIVIVGMSNLSGKQILMAQGKQRQFNISVTAGAIFSFLFNFLLIPKLGALGAAVGSILSELLVLSIFLYFARDELKITTIFQIASKYIIASLVMLVAIEIVNINVSYDLLALILEVGCGVIVYGVMLIITRDKFAELAIHKVMDIRKKKQ